MLFVHDATDMKLAARYGCDVLPALVHIRGFPRSNQSRLALVHHHVQPGAFHAGIP